MSVDLALTIAPPPPPIALTLLAGPPTNMQPLLDAFENGSTKPGMMATLRGDVDVPAGWAEVPGMMARGIQIASISDIVLLTNDSEPTVRLSNGRGIVTWQPGSQSIDFDQIGWSLTDPALGFNSGTTVAPDAVPMAAEQLDPLTMLAVWRASVGGVDSFVAQRFTFDPDQYVATKTHEVTLACGDYAEPLLGAHKYQAFARCGGVGLLRLRSVSQSKPLDYLAVDFATAALSVKTTSSSYAQSRYIASIMASRNDGVVLFAPGQSTSDSASIDTTIRVRALAIDSDGNVTANYANTVMSATPWSAIPLANNGASRISLAALDDDGLTFLLFDKVGIFTAFVDVTAQTVAVRQITGLHPLLERTLLDGSGFTTGAGVDFCAMKKDPDAGDNTLPLSLYTAASSTAPAIEMAIDLAAMRAGFGRVIVKV